MKWWVIGESNSAGVLLQSRPLPEPHPDCDEWGESWRRACFPYSPRNWRPARESNPSHSMDSGAASSDASQTLREDALLERRRLAAVSAATHAGAVVCCCAVRAQDAAEGRCVPAAARRRRSKGRDPDWCVWSDSNGHCVRSRRTPSADWGTDASAIRLQDQVGGPGWRTRLDSNQRGADARPLKRRLPSIAWLLVRYSTIGILEDTVGLAPTLRRLRASRVKSPVRSLLRSRVRNGVCLRCSWWPLLSP
jgi:hypothetical protein